MRLKQTYICTFCVRVIHGCYRTREPVHAHTINIIHFVKCRKTFPQNLPCVWIIFGSQTSGKWFEQFLSSPKALGEERYNNNNNKIPTKNVSSTLLFAAVADATAIFPFSHRTRATDCAARIRVSSGVCIEHRQHHFPGRIWGRALKLNTLWTLNKNNPLFFKDTSILLFRHLFRGLRGTSVWAQYTSVTCLGKIVFWKKEEGEHKVK